MTTARRNTRPAPVVAAARAPARAPARTPARAPAASAVSAAVAQPPRRLVIEYIDITDIVPYEWNPRQNAEAVASVAASMRLTEGFGMPIVVDVNNVIIAGHTRVEAAKSLGYLEVPVVRLSHLSPEQVNAFRVVDNKVAENAKWDDELLAGEIAKLSELGLDFTDYGWTQASLDCMSQLVAEDCLSVTTLAPVAAEAVRSVQGRRGPQTARFVLGELTFFIPVEKYRTWADGVRQLNDFSEEHITTDLMRRLGIPE